MQWSASAHDLRGRKARLDAHNRGANCAATAHNLPVPIVFIYVQLSVHCHLSLASDEMVESRRVEAMVCGEAVHAQTAPLTVPLAVVMAVRLPPDWCA